MNRYALLLVPLVAIAGCKSKVSTEKASASAAAVGLTDLSASVEAIRAEFNAHKQEARFLTLLSPA